MSKPFLAAFAVAIAVIGFLIWQGFEGTKGNHLDPTGKIGKIRAQQVDPNEVIAVVDFSLKNDADIAMVVRNIEAKIEMSDGSFVDGSLLAGTDLANFFRNYQLIGEQFNPPLRPRDPINGHQVADRMVGIRFDVPEDKFNSRRNLVLRIEDVTGPVLEMKK